jgi:hypothetical protein
MKRRFFDYVLIGMVLIFAFLASSFAVRNSDFWLHLASGRLLAERRFPFGVDPFAFTTENQYWANHAWLFDWPLYLLYNRLGEWHDGALLVVLKALLVTLLALVLLLIRRPGSGLGWPTACTLLAVLAMSPRLLLHSTLLSYVLLALTLWLLWRPIEQDASFGRQVRHYAPLLLLFVLWVNVDGWFLLGPLLAALFWLGERLLPNRNASEGLPHTPAWLWPAGLAVCLINPYHVHAFTLPTELMPLPEALRHDVRFASLHTSPWHGSLYYGSLAGVNLARVAYLVLLAAGAMSFLLNARNFAGWRLLVWLTLAGLSAWLVGMIPFFAVVAAPITALNLQDAFAPRQEAQLHRRLRFRLAGVCYCALALSAFALMVLAWLGWLQGFRDIGRHVAWAVQPDASLRRVAERLHLWHTQGKLGKGRGFLSDSSLVHYCAYFCPEEKGFLDPRLSLFRDVAGEYEAIRQALNPAEKEKGDSGNYSRKSTLSPFQILHDRNITHLVLYDPDVRRLFPVLMRLADNKEPWTLLEIAGQALIVGWRNDKGMQSSEVPPFDADRLAFSTASAQELEPMLGEAPGQGPERGPRSEDWWSQFGKPIAPSPWQSETAAVLLYYFDALAPYEEPKRLAWVASLPVLPALSAGSLDPLRLAVHLELAPGQQSPALPLLAVRAARQALAENPDDANAYLRLGQAYLDLAGRTNERQVLGVLPALFELRHIQIAVALENVVRRDPNSLLARQQLALLYERHKFFDAALDHYQAILELMRRAGAGSGEDAAAFARRLEPIERAVRDLERLVRDRKNEFALKARNLGSTPYRKAELALNMGLARLALEDVLMTSSPVLLGGEGVRLQVRLQMMLGRVDPIRDQLHSKDWRENKNNLGEITLEEPASSTAPPYRLPAYEWLLLCQTAADGDYDGAEAVLHTLVRGLEGERAIKAANDFRQSLAQLVAMELGGWGQTQFGTHPWPTTLILMQGIAVLDRMAQQAELHILAGMLALERGRPQQAKRWFQQARTLSRLAYVSLSGQFGDVLAQTYLRLLTAP